MVISYHLQGAEWLAESDLWLSMFEKCWTKGLLDFILVFSVVQEI